MQIRIALLIGLIICPTVIMAQSITHHDFTVELHPETNEIVVTDKITVPKNKIKNNSFTFLLHDGDAVSSEDGKVVLKKHNLNETKAKFPKLIKSDMSVGRVKINAYSATLPNNQKSVTLKYKRKINHEIASGGEEYERSISDSPGLITKDGVYLAQESFWFPVLPDTMQTFTMTINLPLGWKSVSQGERTQHKDTASIHSDTWIEKKPQDDIFIVAAKFTEYVKTVGKVKAYAFLRSEDPALSQKYLDVTAQYLDMYNNLLGEFPYKKFALVENFWETGWGMPSFTLLGSRIIRFPFILHSSYPHELLHNWWGNSVYVDTTNGNWAEGLTAYLADHLVKEQRNQGDKHRRGVLQKYTNFAKGDNDFPLTNFVSRFDAVSEAVGYGKTLMLFHMLRNYVGDQLFTKSMQDLYTQYQFKAADFYDIERIFSKNANQDLSGFFDQWIKQTGAPQLVLKDSKIEKQNNNKFTLSFSINQVQAGAAYNLIVPVYVTLGNKKDAIVTKIALSEKSTLTELEFDSRPTLLEIDPMFDVFRKLDTHEIPPSLSSLFGAEDVIIVLPSNASSELKNAYENLANNWKKSQRRRIGIVFDSELSSLPSDKAVWLIGYENKFADDVMRDLSLYSVTHKNGQLALPNKNVSTKENSVIVVARNPKKESSSIGFVAARNVNAVAGLARKLPHYGKYSYLAFEGDAPDNIAKGQWPAVKSPLVKRFTNNAQRASTTPVSALAELAPSFSEKNLMEHVVELASDKMKGRGLGTKELDLAADYIARKFSASGLKPLPSMSNYFQNWKANVDGLGDNISMTNVVGYIPGANKKLAGESVIVSAHYDHLGLGWPDVRQGNKGKIHNGADDNASGVSVMLELANVLAKSKGIQRSIIFVAFTGEEANKLGSQYFVEHFPGFDLDKVIGVVNLDTVGRLGKNKLTIFGAGSASEWVHIFRGVGFVTGIKSNVVKNDFGSSDHSSFLEKNIPAIQLFSGANADFHNPSDTVEKLDLPGMVKVATVLKETVTYLSERETFLENLLDASKNKPKEGKQKSGRKVSLGTVPDFGFEGKGVLVSDVVPKSPADKAGIKANDIIIGINADEVTSLRSFSNVLRKYKPSDDVIVKIKREDNVLEISATLKAR